MCSTGKGENTYMATGAQLLTVNDFIAFESAEGMRSELIHGELILSPDPKPLHQDVAANIFMSLRQVLAPTDYHVNMRTNMLLHAHEMPSPDVFVIDRKRWTDALTQNTYPIGAPQLAVEVVSPANKPKYVREKVSLYLNAGALAVWVVYLEPKWTVVEHKAEYASEFRQDEMITLPAPLPNETLKVASFFEGAH
jgi:Uma2 family endonuclease